MRVLNCTEFERRLHESVETRMAVDRAALRSHAADCDNCRRLWEEHQVLKQAVAEWRSAAPHVDLADAVLARHAFNQPLDFEGESTPADTHAGETAGFARGSRFESRPQVVLHSARRASEPMPPFRQQKHASAVLAASALVLFLIASPFSPSTVDDQSADRPLAATRMASTQHVSATDVETLVRDAGSAYLELVRDAASVFTDTVVLIPAQALPSAAAAPASDSDTDDPDRLAPWGQEWDPIRRDVGQAIDFLFETIATDAEPTT